MEWTDYRDALVRGLWLVAVLGIVGAGVGLLLPKTVVHPDWVTTTSVGAPPAVNGVGSPIPSGVSTDQIQYYAASDGVFTEAATLAHIDEPQYVLRSWVTVTGPCGANCTAGSGTLPGIVEISVKAPSSVESATFNVAFDEALQLAVDASATHAEQRTARCHRVPGAADDATCICVPHQDHSTDVRQPPPTRPCSEH